jgi:hypothetical protein
MTVIKLLDKDPNEVIDIVKELRASGMVQGKDFDFAFYQTRWDPMIGDVKGFTSFTFYEEKLATLFALRYGS